LILTVQWSIAPAAGAATNAVRDFGFGPLEIYRFERDTVLLKVREVNRDERADIVFANNRASRLEILVRRPAAAKSAPAQAVRPPLEERFDNRGFVVDQQIIAYELEDVNGDQRPDALVLGREQGLELRLQDADGNFQPPRKIYLARTDNLVTMQAADFNGDRRPDLLVGRPDSAEILWNDGGAFTSRTELAFASANCQWLDVADFNGDGRMDVLFYFPSESLPLHYRPGDGRGGFALENLMPRAAVRAMSKLEWPGARSARLGSVPRHGRVFRLQSIAPKPVPDFLAQDEAVVQRLPLRGMGQKHTPAWVIADFNGDGWDDLGVAAPELSQLHVYYGSRDGLAAEPLAINSLFGITAISLTKAGDVLVFSPAEKAAALHAGRQLAQFPRLLPLPEKPLLAMAVPGTDDYFCLARAAGGGGEAELIIRGLSGATNAAVRRYACNLANDPDSARVLQLAPGALGFLLFAPYQPPDLLLLKNEQLTKLSAAAFSALAQPAAAAAFAAAEPDGRRLLAAQNRLVRAYQWQTTDVYTAVGQFSPDNENAQVNLCIPFKAGGRNGVMMYDQNAGDLLWQAEGGPAAQRRTHVPCPLTDLNGMAQLQANDPAHSTLLLMGRAELFVFRNGAAAYTLKEEGEYASPAEQAALGRFEVVQLGQARRPMVAIVDERNRSLELVALKDGGLKSELIFAVFLEPRFTPAGHTGVSGAEPHAMASGDVTGDGLPDLVVLAHDKLIIYPGE
jgi:hypothetical protein